jgi:HlyD family secretion protein
MNGKDTVFVVKDGRVEFRTIETGIENDDYIEVVSGVTAGEKVVVDPDSKLKAGEKVKPKK